MLNASKRKFEQKIIIGKKIIIRIEVSFIPSFYPGVLPSSIPERLKPLFGLFLVASIIGILMFIFIRWQQSSSFFGFSPYKEVHILDLLSFANLYNGKKICTKGYYVDSPSYSVLKVSLREDEFTRSAWVDLKDHEIITGTLSGERAVVVNICGYFESRRDGEFGYPAVWNHQLTVDSFKTEGEPFSF